MARGVDVLVATPGRLLDHIGRAHRPARPGRDPRARRGRPDARHGLRRADPASIVAEMPPQAPEPVLLGHHAERDPALAGELLHDPAARRGGAGGHHGRARRPARDPSSSRRASAPCWPSCSTTRHQAGASSSPAPSAAPTAWPRAWNRPASTPPPSTATRARASASARWPAFKAGKSPRPGRHRHRRPRHRHRRRQPRRPVRTAQRAGELRPPHRPHRPRRRDGSAVALLRPTRATTCAPSRR